MVSEPWEDPRLDPRQMGLLRTLGSLIRPRKFRTFSEVSKSREDFLRKVEKLQPVLLMMQSKMLQETRIHHDFAPKDGC